MKQFPTGDLPAFPRGQGDDVEMEDVNKIVETDIPSEASAEEGASCGVGKLQAAAAHHPLTPSSERRGVGTGSPPRLGGGEGVVEVPPAAARPQAAVAAVSDRWSAIGTPPLQRRWARNLVIATLAAGTVAVSLVLVFALDVAGLRERLLGVVGAVRESPLRIQSIAVLPLENLSRDPEQEYFADGMTEALITDLGKISALRVISRTSVMQYKGTKKPLPEIARELKVDAVLEGTVARSGSRVRITANLLHAPTDRHLWAETYEGDLGDVLALQGEVARAIADQIRIKLTPEEQGRFAPPRPVNPEAHEAYLKGRYYWNLRTEDGLKKSIEYFQQAIEKDPGYTRAYAGLADSYAVSVMWGFAPPREAYPRAKAAALKALQVDHTQAEPHASLGVAKVDFDFDFVGAEKEYKLAVKLDPSYATAHVWYAVYLALVGRHNEAFTEIKRAQELDPLSLSISAVGAAVFLYARRYDEAVAECQRTLELKPDFYLAHYYLGEVYEQQKLYAQAIGEYQKALALEPGNSIVGTALACGYAAAGKRSEALKHVSRLKQLSRRRYVSPYAIACIYAALGDVDQACAWLEKAYEDRSYGLYSLKVNPRFDLLRSDPRFQDLLRRMNFPP